MEKDNDLETIEELNFSYDDGAKISLYENPIKSGRKDKSTFITEGDLSMRSSNIMLGSDNKNLQDGVYVNAEEVKNALLNYLNKSGENKLIKSKKTGKKVTNNEIMEEVFKSLKKISSLKLGEKNYKIKNQDTRTIFIKENDSRFYKKSGILMLGNKGFKLPCGEYILEEELQKALEEYILIGKEKNDKKVKEDSDKKSTKDFFTHMEGEEIVLDSLSVKELPDNEKENDDVLKKLLSMTSDWNSDNIETLDENNPSNINDSKNENKVKRKNKKAFGVALLLASTTAILSTLGVTGGNIKQKEKVTKNVNYTIDSYEDRLVYETYEELSDRISKSLVIGSYSYFPAGINYHESSDYDFGGKNNNDVIGNELRKEGNYNIDYFSILKNGKIMYVERDNGKSLDDTINMVSTALNCNKDDLKVRIHFGGEKITGWTDFDEYIDKSKINKESYSKKVYLDTISGSVKDTDDKIITIKDEDNFVYIPYDDVSKEVKSSDKSYVLTNVSYSDSVTKENEVEDVDIGLFKDNVSIPLTALAGASGALLMYEHEKKKKLKEAKSNSKFEKFKDKLMKKIRGKSL